MTFWIIIMTLAAIVTLALLLALVLQGGAIRPSAAMDIAVYREQLVEVDRDLARGVIDPETAERARIEISRRILDADRTRTASAPANLPRAASIAAGVALALMLVPGSLGIYAWLGAPGYRDLPLQTRIEAGRRLRETRPGQEAAERQATAMMPQRPPPDPGHADLVQQLRAKLSEGEADPLGLRLLARNEAMLGNYRAAHAAQARLIALLGGAASAADHADHGELLILAAGGYVSPEAEAALREALARDPANGPALYYLGLLHEQTDRPDLAFRVWRGLLERGPPQAPWVPVIRARIAEVAARAGVAYEPPPAAPPVTPDAPFAAPVAPTAPRGPSQADIDAAAEMTPEARMEMIRSMVSGLSGRLAEQGGPPEDWAQLIGALGALGDTDQARAIWREAQSVFSSNDTALAMLDQAAARAGLTQ